MPFFKGWLSFNGLCDKIKELLTATTDWVHVVTLSDRMALRHVPSNRYLTIQRKIVSPNYTAGIQFCLSSAFDYVNNQPTGSVKAVFAPLYYSSDSNKTNYFYNTYIISSIMTYPVTIWADRRGFLLAMQNPYSYSDGTSLSAFVNVEYIPLQHREYNDGLEGFFMHSIRNDFSFGSTNNGGLGTAHYCARDVALETQARIFCMHDRKAFMSEGSKRVYFEFPTYYNDVDRKTVAAMTKRWFLLENDILKIPTGFILKWQDGQTLRKFYIARIYPMNNPPSGINVAIPYSNAYDYPE